MLYFKRSYHRLKSPLLNRPQINIVLQNAMFSPLIAPVDKAPVLYFMEKKSLSTPVITPVD